MKMPWYKKKRYIIPIGLFVLFILFSSSGSKQTKKPDQTINPVVNEASIFPIIEKTTDVISQPKNVEIPVTQDSSLSNNNYYINVDGDTVHAPAFSDSIPDDASARCRDGSYSFSRNRRGTCSHHGGVSEWY